MNRILLVLIFLGLFACDKNRIFEENTVLLDQYWHVDSVARFEFDVVDLENKYDLFFNIRNTSAYPYYNLYLKHTLKDSADEVLESSLENLILFDAKTGAPKGSGLGDVFDHQIKLKSKYNFPYQGRYSIEFQQFMRIDSLPMVHFVGARLALSTD